MADRNKKPGQALDRLFATERETGEFRFDTSVARVFPDMIRRSVPGYTTIIPMIEVITEQYARPGSHCYDLAALSAPPLWPCAMALGTATAPLQAWTTRLP